MDNYRHLFLTEKPNKAISFALIYLLSTIFAFQTLLTAFIGSTYLEQFIPAEYVGLVYATGSFGAIVLILLSSNILRKIGNVAYILILILSLIILLLFLGFAPTPTLTVVAFALYMATFPQIYLNIDIFLETLIGTDEHSTGSRRGIILSLMSVASFCAPLTMGYIVGGDNNLPQVYFSAAGIAFLIFILVVARFRHFYDPPYEAIDIRTVLINSLKNLDIKIVMYAQFLLQLFFTWAVIYIPLYLATEIGFDWSGISKIIAAGLFAFILVEYPAGRLADEKIGEKEMMATGFLFLALASATITFTDSTNILTWMVLMFVSRIGASLVEVTSESYFFKHVQGDDSNVISFFRLTRPLGNLIGAGLGSLALIFLPFNLIFIILALIMTTGIFATIRLTDTK
ncbi:MAG: MFS transporter [Candidatus Nomurabacteria bacterium]|nr:MAG: MFS transporter [Candidatus Nomurabacteria bacterium]